MRPDERTDDAILGGRLKLLQPRRGHRFGHDAILLAASVPAKPGEQVAEFGSGVGAASLALLARVPNLNVTMVEIAPDLADLAKENARRNGFGTWAAALVADAGGDLSAHGLTAGSFDRVLMNPPFNAGTLQASPDPDKRRAHAGSPALLEGWLRNAGWLLRAGGTVTAIWRAEHAEALLDLLARNFGGAMIRPVYGKDGQPAIRAIVTATKGSTQPKVILPQLVLNDAQGRPTQEAETVMRTGAALTLPGDSSTLPGDPSI
jgi:tRNA1(Val) A37 N6-methylase TrmN6